MRSIVKGVACAGAFCLLAGTARGADDGLLIVQTTTSGGTPQTHQVQIERNRMRAETAGAMGAKQVFVFDGTKQALTIIDPDKKTYSEMTKDDAEALGGQVSDAMAQMQKQMANLPPEQRAQIESMMKGRGLGGPPAARKLQYRRAGTGTVGKWMCDKYEGFEDGQKTSEVCTVDPKVLGFAASDFDVSKQLAAFFKKMLPQMGDRMFAIGSLEDQGYSGVPVRQSMTVAGREVTTEINEVSRQSFPDSIFQVPAGYQKTAFMGGRGRGRQ